MPRESAKRDFFEPWKALPRRLEKPMMLEDGTVVDESTDHVLWGSRMADPGVALSLLGRPAGFDDTAIIAVVRTPPVKPDKCKTTGKDLAARVASCVNACRHIADPESTLDRVRSLLKDLAFGHCDQHDPRVVALLSRMPPPGAAALFNEESED